MKQRFLIFGICLLVAAIMCLTVSWPGSGSSGHLPPLPSTGPTTPSNTGPTPPTDGAVRLHITDTQKLDIYEQLAQQYTGETGIPVTIITGTLEEVMDGKTAPTIFCVTDSASLSKWQDRLLDLTDTAILSQLCNSNFALTANGVPVGVAMDVSGYGLVYNAALLAQVAYTRSDLSDFTVLTTVVEHITGKTASLGFGAFCSPDFGDRDFVAQLCGISTDPRQLRSFCDLYIRNDTSSGTPLDSFLSGKTAFYVGGSWENDRLAALGFNNLDLLPLYTADGGTLQCICSHYWCVNAQSTPQEIAASLDFLYWLVTAPESGPAPVDSLGYLAPFADATVTGNSFLRLLRKYIATEPVTVRWALTGAASEQALSLLSNALQNYAANPTDDNWATVSILLENEIKSPLFS